MSKTVWTIVGISAVTDAFVAFGTAYTAAAAEAKDFPTWPSIVAAAIGALVIGTRTIQQFLKTQLPKGDIGG